MSNLLQVWNTSAPLRFLLVGGWNFAFGYGCFALLYWAFSGFWPNRFVATVLGITMSFVTHRFLTYRSHGCWWKEYLRFYVVYGGAVPAEHSSGAHTGCNSVLDANGRMRTRCR